MDDKNSIFYRIASRKKSETLFFFMPRTSALQCQARMRRKVFAGTRTNQRTVREFSSSSLNHSGFQYQKYSTTFQRFSAFAFLEGHLPAALQQVHPRRRPLPGKRESSSLPGGGRCLPRPRTHELRRRNREVGVAAYSMNARQNAPEYVKVPSIDMLELVAYMILNSTKKGWILRGHCQVGTMTW